MIKKQSNELYLCDMKDAEQILLKGRCLEEENSIDEAISMYLRIANENIRDLRAYDRILVLYRKRKDYEKEISLSMQAILVVMILGNKTMSIEDIQKNWESIVDDLANNIVVEHQDCRIAFMDMDSRLKFMTYIKRYFSSNLLLQRRITREFREAKRSGAEIAHSSPDGNVKEVNKEDDVSEYTPLEQQNISSTQRRKKHILWAIFLLLSIWLIITYPWIMICVGVVILAIGSSIYGSGGNVRGHLKKNGTYINSYYRRARR